MIKAGFWTQLILLGLVDWGSLQAFASRDVVHPIHYLGFALVNAILLGLTAMMWRWMRDKKSVRRPSRKA